MHRETIRRMLLLSSVVVAVFVVGVHGFAYPPTTTTTSTSTFTASKLALASSFSTTTHHPSRRRLCRRRNTALLFGIPKSLMVPTKEENDDGNNNKKKKNNVGVAGQGGKPEKEKTIGLAGMIQLITAGMGAPFLGDFQGMDKDTGKMMFTLEANNLVDEKGRSKQTQMPYFESGWVDPEEEKRAAARRQNGFKFPWQT